MQRALISISDGGAEAIVFIGRNLVLLARGPPDLLAREFNFGDWADPSIGLNQLGREKWVARGSRI